jgi:hypothetical protein
MDLCVFDIFLIFNLFRWNEYAFHSDFLKYDFYYFYGTQVGLQFGTVCSNMSRNINVNFHTPGMASFLIIPC